VSRLLAARAPLLEAAGEELLLWCPDADPSAGGGALLPPRELLGEGADAGGGRFVFGAVAPADALPVVPLVAIVPGAPPAAGALAGSRGLATLIVVLAATFGGGLFVALRMVRREVELTGARARFLTNVTHELKTPLASIRLFSEMLLDGRVESEAKRDEYHRLLAGESERLSALIENVLDLGRIERGERALDLASRRVDELAREVVERFAPLAARDGVSIETRGLDAPCAAVCDRGAFAQALVNLLDNSRKYAASGGQIEVALERAAGAGVDRGGGQDLGLVRVCVRDFGPGIPEEERARIFEPFVRGERQRDGAIAGLGLGLHLARTLARAQGGELVCEAPDGGGARFVLTLPAATETSATTSNINGAAP
jgi:two-component system phosphate regulon sensor histidine kinase PhoR